MSSAFTRAEVNQFISEYKTAIRAVLSGQTYSMDTGQGRISVTRASLGQLERGLQYWVQEKERLDGGTDIVSLEVEV